MKNKVFTISGRVIEHEHHKGVPGLRVEVWDKDLLVDDVVGSAITGKDGSFRITFDESYFSELFFDRTPDIYFRVYSQGQVVKNTRDSVLWNVKTPNVEVLIELEKLPLPVQKETAKPGHDHHRMDVDFIQHAATSRRADALFKAMSTDFLLREQFVTDPSQVMSEFVHGKSLPPEEAAISNQMLYSVMSNPGLLRWLRDYSIKLGGHQPSRERFTLDFSRAVVENKGYQVLLALIRSSVEKENIYSFDEILLPVIFGIYTRGDIFASGTEMSTGTYATEVSGTHISGGIFASGTEMSTGTYATEQSGTHISGGIFASGTEMSTGTYATEQSGTHMSGGIFASGTEMSTGTYATEQSGTHMSGGIFASGTEMSTGTYATEQSGTHMSGGIISSRYALVTLEALVQYATQLRNSGALDIAFTRRR